VLVVVLLFPVQGIPLVSLVLIVTPVTVPVAHPAAGAIVVVAAGIFRLFPTSIAVAVAFDANAMVTIRVAALVGARDGWGR
jgi:hypothetical protein